MGLTGAIVWATVRVRRVSSPLLRVESFRFKNILEFFDIDAAQSHRHEYAVASVDCLAKGKSPGRGIFSVATHAQAATAEGTRAGWPDE